MITADQVLQALQQHIGHRRGIGARALADDLHISERYLRNCISALRERGIAVCGTPDTGYYVAETAAELEQCCAFLRSRALHSLMIEARLRGLPLADLVGQLTLPT